jgi:hypothetical protein
VAFFTAERAETERPKELPKMNIAVVILDGLSSGLVLQYLSIVQPDSHHPNSQHPFNHRAFEPMLPYTNP